ncbi:hypothetical protein OKW21_003270 [Catalinimonas alkaloidigena]|uniref:porin family protein n=1 Tax=Catalinimonas alkaloidigena TaxID=1075417 RepID=UPI0024054495|nr:porin family protein [Catalinimonas alkaloidigena]MDF9798007.1 hypothetical protein [Catalinimonas alkaloidigena]
MKTIHLILISSSENLWKTVTAIFCAFLLLTLATKVQAQNFPDSRVGLRAGANLNSWTNDFPYVELNRQRIYPDAWEATTGFHLGIYFNVRLAELFALEPAIMFSQKGTGTSLDLGGSSFAKGTIVSNYIDIPILMRLYVAEGFNLFLGPQLSYQLGSTYSLSIDNELLIDDEDTSNDISELDAGLVLGLGYEFEEGFNINLSGEFGLLSVDSYKELDTYVRTIRLSAGYTFK